MIINQLNLNQQYFLIVLYLLTVDSFWQPSYNISFHDEETLDFSENFEDIDEEEMIPKPPAIFARNKYFRFHQLIRRYNTKDKDNWNFIIPDKTMKIFESNFEREDPVPWEARLVDENNNTIGQGNANVFYYNTIAKSFVEEKINEKRAEDIETETKIEKEYYDYENFKQEYEAKVAESLHNSKTLNFTDVKEKETVEDLGKELIDFKVPKNCSQEESKGIGYRALICIGKDMIHADVSFKRKLFRRFITIILIWVTLYIVIAIPCWCQRGWCCCFCEWCCLCCRPREIIDDARHFFMNNPPGVYHDEKGNKIRFKSTAYEETAQLKLEHAVLNI